MKEHNRKLYDAMVKEHEDMKQFEAFRSIFLAVVLFIALVIVLCKIWS